MISKKSLPRYVVIATAANETEAIRMRILLDRTQIPYVVQGEHLHSLYGIAGSSLFGPMEFKVPEGLAKEATAALDEIFEVRGEIPDTCPACGSPTVRHKLECPACGLYLA